MPRPKKKKALPAMESKMESGVEENVELDPSESSAPSPSPVAEPPPPPSPGGRVLAEAKRNYDEALLKSRWLDEAAKDFKGKERLAERLCDAKYKRAESKQKRKPKNPYGVYGALHEDVRGAHRGAAGQA